MTHNEEEWFKIRQNLGGREHISEKLIHISGDFHYFK